MTPELARLICAQIFLHACMTGLRLGAPLLALSRGEGPVAVGVLLALFALMQVFLALPAGRFADRHGLRRPVGFSVVAAVSGAGLAAAFPVFSVLCIAALLTGGATGAALIALQRHVGRASQGVTQLRQVFSWLSIGPAVSNFLGPFSAGWLIDHAGASPGSQSGYRAAFAVLALFPVATWLLVRRSQEIPADSLAVNPAPPKAWDLLREPMFRRLLLVNWLLSSCWDIHTFVVPVLGFERGISASSIGAILGGFAIAAAVVRLLLPWVAAQVSEWRVLAGAMLCAAVLLGVYPLLHSAWLMGVCSGLLGLALGAVQPMVMSMLHQITPEARHGEALGLRLMTINASSVVLPVAFGALGTVIGVGVVFWVAAGAVGVGATAAWRLKRAPTHPAR